MASYTVTHTCGHTKTYYSGLFADNRDAAAKANAANTMCQDCIEYEESVKEYDDPFRNPEYFSTPAPRGKMMDIYGKAPAPNKR